MGKPEYSKFKSPRPKAVATRSRRSAGLIKPVGKPLGSNIKVVVRVRPPNEKETGDHLREIIELVDDETLIFDPKVNNNGFFFHGVEQKRRDMLLKVNKNLQFRFDRVLGYSSENQEVFEETTKNLIECLMDGYNCSVFAYGATGAGKTHTMLGQNGDPGITFLTMSELFKAKDELLEERSFELGISYIEVYNEQVQDLLNPGPPLQLRDDGRYGTIVAGMKCHKINNPEELFNLLEKGNSHRTQHPTDANKESSRSHAVFQLFIEMKFKVSREVRTAKLSMIDLAGSERGAATGFKGARFTEGANINKSLLALGNCINSLADGQKYVPFRDSKLTRLLKDSLGGNCRTVMVANVAPSFLTYEDTCNTLKYAARAMKITTDTKKNIVNIERHSGEYLKIVQDLKKENENLKKEVETLKSQLKQAEAGSKQAEDKFKFETDLQMDPKISAEFIDLTKKRTQILERLHHIEAAENIVILRRQIKEQANSRLSNLLTEDVEKEDAHRRLCDAVTRLNKQENTLNSELAELKLEKIDIEQKISVLLEQHSSLEQISTIEKLRISNLEFEHQLNLERKKNAIAEEEFNFMMDLFGKVAKSAKSYYHQLHGHGLLSDASTESYRSLESLIQGRRHVSFNSLVDSGVVSTSTSSTVTCSDKSLKRKNDDQDLDGTYVLEENAPKPRVKVCADVIAKAFSSPNYKKKDLETRWKNNKLSAAVRGVKRLDKSKSQTRPPFRM